MCSLMTTAVEKVLGVLSSADFEVLAKPLVVSGATFDFDAAVKGTGVSHDLIVLAGSEFDARRLMRLLSGLTRTLDQSESRRPVSLVLVGASSNKGLNADLERYARVLHIEGDQPSMQEIRRAIAVLLPLELPSSTVQNREPLAEVAAAMGGALSPEHQGLLEAAKFGEAAVRDTLRRYIDDAVTESPEERAQDERASAPKPLCL